MTHRTKPLRRAVLGAIAGACLLALAPAALAQTYPSKPIRLVVPAPAGGSSDLVARVLAEGLTPLLGQTVIVDNKPGGLGAIAVQDLLSAPHDGYSFLIGPNGLISEVPHIAKPRFDPFKDIKPLAELSRSGLVMVGNTALPCWPRRRPRWRRPTPASRSGWSSSHRLAAAPTSSRACWPKA